MNYAPITTRLADTGGAKWAVHSACRERRAAGADIVELTIGEPDMPPDPRLIDVCETAMRSGRTAYSSGRGEPGLLDAIAERYTRRRDGISHDNILCFPGTQTALFATIMGLASTGDEVLVGDPYYATYEGVIKASGAEPVSVPLSIESGFELQAQQLETCITERSRVLLLNYPHNPTGAILSPEQLVGIGAVCAKHGLWIVCDEVYEDLVFDGAFHSLFDNPLYQDRTIALSSISKSHAAPGFRSGWAVGPAEFCDRLLPLSETMLFGNQPFIADMTAYALSTPSDVAARMAAAYQRRARMICDACAPSPVLRALPPRAGMFITIDVSASGLDGETFAWKLLDAGVAVMPGSSFGQYADALIRLSLTVPDEAIEQAITRLISFTEALS